MTRQQFIRLIHVAQRELRLDDDTYRQFLANCTGHRSSKDMNMHQLRLAVDSLRKLGFKPKTKTGEKISATDAQSAKIRALWLEMADAGFIHDRSELAINAFVHRCTGTGRLEWLSTDAASRVIERLKKWQARELRAKTQLQD